MTFDNRAEGKDDNGFINGDGVLIYPGEEKLHPEQDRGIADQVRGGLVPPHQQQEGEGDQLRLAEALSFDLGREQCTQQVVARLAPPPTRSPVRAMLCVPRRSRPTGQSKKVTSVPGVAWASA